MSPMRKSEEMGRKAFHSGNAGYVHQDKTFIAFIETQPSEDRSNLRDCWSSGFDGEQELQMEIVE